MDLAGSYDYLFQFCTLTLESHCKLNCFVDIESTDRDKHKFYIQ